MAFPRMNNISFWLCRLLSGSLDLDLRRVNLAATGRRGWTIYAPLSTSAIRGRRGFRHPSLHLAGASSILAPSISSPRSSICARGMTLHKEPLFVWSILVTVFLLLAVAAGARRRHHHAAGRIAISAPPSSTPNTRRSGAVPASVLVLRHPESTSDPAGLRHGQPDRLDLSKNRCRLSRHGLCDGGDRRHRLCGVGPHMYTVGMSSASRAYFVAATM